MHHQQAGFLGYAHGALDIGAFDSSPLGAIADTPPPPRPTLRGSIQDGDKARSERDRGLGRGALRHR
jgi:hypothetical protein